MHRKPSAPAAYRPVLELLETRLVLSTNVVTYHNDLALTGQNLTETTLTPDNVNFNTFGQLASYPVDGQLYAQPLYVAGLTLSDGRVHDVVFAATEHDSVYAFDANGGGLLWQTSFLDSDNGVMTVPASETGSGDITPEIGITSTPTIDPTANLLYVVAQTKEVGDGHQHYVQRLHALDLTSGQEALGGPATIADTIYEAGKYTYVSGPSVPGTGAGSVNGVITYNALRQNQRPALTLSNGVVYVASASHGDNGPYHGWLLGYDAQTLDLVSQFNNTPNGSQGGIWMSGAGPAVDANGDLFLSTGNGSVNLANGSYSQSVLHLSTSGGGLDLADYFIPYDWNNGDNDLGSSGVTLLPDQPGPHPHLAVLGNKSNTIYVVDRDNLGGLNNGYDDVVQKVHGSAAFFDTFAYFDGGDANGPWIYVGASGDKLRAYQMTDGLLSSSPTSVTVATFGNKGVTPVVSANGTSDAIVWVLDKGGSHAILRAYDALDLAHQLYTSEDAPGGRDRLDAGIKFTQPVVADGKVFAGTTDSLAIFGLLPGNLSVPGPRGGAAAGGLAAAGDTVFSSRANGNPFPNLDPALAESSAGPAAAISALSLSTTGRTVPVVTPASLEVVRIGNRANVPVANLADDNWNAVLNDGTDVVV